MKFSIKKIIILLFILICSISTSFSAGSFDHKIKKISKNLRCITCQGQSIDASNSDFALDVKNFIKIKLNEGLDEKQIYELLKKKYGSWIVFKPEFKYDNYLLWGFPYLIFLIGGIYIVIKIRKKIIKF
tara:strand:- start:2065 stop:2451 length:387 start_codon:yes stop_codon:yes gene_type:complete